MAFIFRNDSISDLRSIRMRQIERDAPFVAIQIKIKSALIALRYGSDITVLAAFTTFDTNHIRAKIGKQHGTIGRGNETPEVNDSNPS